MNDLTKNNDPIENTVKNFVQSDKPSVLVLKGSWGIGKTHFWNKWIKEEKAKNESTTLNKSYSPTKKHYAYVSLFGLNSLNDLKKEIAYTAFSNTNSVNY